MDKDKIRHLSVKRLEMENAVCDLYKEVNYMLIECAANGGKLDIDDTVALDNIQNFCVKILQA